LNYCKQNYKQMADKNSLKPVFFHQFPGFLSEKGLKSRVFPGLSAIRLGSGTPEHCRSRQKLTGISQPFFYKFPTLQRRAGQTHNGQPERPFNNFQNQKIVVAGLPCPVSKRCVANRIPAKRLPPMDRTT